MILGLLFGGCPAQQFKKSLPTSDIIHKIPYGANAKAGHYVQAKDAKIYFRSPFAERGRLFTRRIIHTNDKWRYRRAAISSQAQRAGNRGRGAEEGGRGKGGAGGKTKGRKRGIISRIKDIYFAAKQAVEMDNSYVKQRREVLLGAIKCPVLVLAGDRDQGNTVEHVINAARMIPKHQISIIPNTTHTVFLENFPAVWASIVPFLKQ